jgi:Putative beta barrel porin-7 (BBP7)
MMRAAGQVAIALLSLECAVASAQTGNADPAAAGPFTVEAEVLVWWYKSSPTPVPIITDGVYGGPNTKVLLGGGEQDTNPNTGFRLAGSYAIDSRWGIDGNFFYIPTRSTSRSVASSGTAESIDLLLPYFDVTRNRENVTEVSFSPAYSGSATEELSNKLMGAELNATSAYATTSPWNITWLGGFRWMQLKETYTVTTSSSYIPPEVPDIWNTTDRFGATNNFYGAQFGAKARYDSDRWFATGIFKLGLGAMVQSVDISGSLATDDFTDNGSIQTFSGGYFALPTNIGSHSRTVFAVLPELQLNVGYRVAPTASIFLGDSFLYTNSVARPGNQMSRNINPTQSVSYVGEPPVSLQGPAQPTFGFNSSSFWAQGITAGLSLRF